MDLGSVVVSSKRLKRSEGEDMISNLPDFLIGVILSLVPIQDAVRTCVLSKRWKYLWTFIPNIFFQDRECSPECELLHLRDSPIFFIRHEMHFTGKENPPFLNLVNGVMLHLNESSIHSFTLIISDKYDSSDVHKWILAALHRRVRKLCVYTYRNITLRSYSLLQFLSLEELALTVGFCTVRVPSSACFTSLTMLKLGGITFTPESFPSSNSENLTLKFPVLRKYVTVGCGWSSVKNVTLEMPQLQEVTILSTILSLYSGDRSVIKFCVSRLKRFTFIGLVFPSPWFLDVSAANIAFADVRLFSHDLLNGEEMRNQACNLLKHFTANVECLKFHWSLTKVARLQKDCLAYSPASKTLSQLLLDSVTIETLLGVLLKTPMLKVLIIYEELFEFDKELLNSATVPDCFGFNLKLVAFGCFNGSEHELSFAKFVMENALVLEKIRFNTNRSICHSEMGKVKEKVFSFKKACSSAIIEFF